MNDIALQIKGICNKYLYIKKCIWCNAPSRALPTSVFRPSRRSFLSGGRVRGSEPRVDTLFLFPLRYRHLECVYLMWPSS